MGAFSGDKLELNSQSGWVNMLEQLKSKSTVIDSLSPIESVYGNELPASEVVADATSKYLVKLSSGERGFLIVSGAGNPDLVARAARNISLIRGMVSDRCAEPIIPPLEVGEIKGSSFAIWPMLGTLPRGRLKKYLVKRQLSPAVLNWLYCLCDETLSKPNSSELKATESQLLTLADDKNSLDIVRRAAADAATKMNFGTWTPYKCVQHSDLWMGNVLIPPRKSIWPFSVVDWAGANASGFPFFDFIKFSESNNLSRKLVRRKMSRYVSDMGFGFSQVLPYTACALAQIHSDLEYFPESMFKSMAGNIIKFADDIIGRGL